MKFRLTGYVLLFIIVLSFVVPFYSPYAYELCPSNPENGFICYCIYKDDVKKKVDNLVYSSSVKKQVSPEKFNSIALSIEEPFVFYEPLNIETIIIAYNIFYKDISQKAPDMPPEA